MTKLHALDLGSSQKVSTKYVVARQNKTRQDMVKQDDMEIGQESGF